MTGVKSLIYLDNAATTYPKPYETLKEYDDCITNYAANAGRGGHKMSIKAAEKIFQTRQIVSSLFNIPTPENVAFTGNATMAINMGLKGIATQGKSVIISSMEHNSVYRPLTELSKYGVKTVIADADEYGFVSPGAIEEKISDHTALICITHASNVTGAVNNIRKVGEIARRHKIVFMVDCAQSAGSTDIDVVRDNIDILAFPGHKGLFGMQGTGGIYVREGINLKTIIEGGTGSLSESDMQPSFMPDMLESGTLNLPGIASLYGGISYVLKRGVKDIREHEERLAAALYERLSSMRKIKIISPFPKEGNTHLVTVVAEGIDSAQFAAVLDKKYNIAVRAGLHCSYLGCRSMGVLETGCIRFSPGAFNTMADINKTAAAVHDICSY